MASISGYRSPLDLGIGQIPITTDPDLFEEFTGVYNAIHLLNASLDSIRFAIGQGGSGEGAPDETLPFSRSYNALALQKMVKGDLVSPYTGNGVVHGALVHSRTSTIPECNFAGIVLTDAEIGEQVRVGIGPAALAVPGAVPGGLIYAYPQTSTIGTLFDDARIFTINPGPLNKSGIGTAYPTVVAIGITEGYALFGKFYKR